MNHSSVRSRNASEHQVVVLVLALFIPVLVIPITALAEDFYVSIDGNDSAGGSDGAPFATIGRGIEELSGGDTLIVRDGLYRGTENFINHTLTPIPDGSEGQPTVIRAENPLRVRIENDGSLGGDEHLVQVAGTYITVDGFILNMVDANRPDFNVAIGGTRNRLTRSIIRREGFQTDHGGWLNVAGSYNLIEDVAGVGAARYGFRTGGIESTSRFHIFRRVVGRVDYTGSNQPKATFAHYGANSGGGSHHVIWQNCIALDSNQPDRNGGNSGYKNGMKANKSAADDMIVGSIILNERVEYAAVNFDGSGHTLLHSIIWGNRRGDYGSVEPAAIWDRSDSDARLDASFLTIGTHTEGVSRSGRVPRSSLIEPSGQRYLVVPNDPDGDGATVLNRIGRSGTFYGDPGWDEVTDDDLWPWAYEDEIKAVFAEPNDPPSESTPPSNNTRRGFTVEDDAFGQPMTLTRYVWQYLGEAIPMELYGDAPMRSDAGVPMDAGPGFDGGPDLDGGPGFDGSPGFDGGNLDASANDAGADVGLPTEPPVGGSCNIANRSRGTVPGFVLALLGVCLMRRRHQKLAHF